MRKAINIVTYRGSRKVAIREGMDFNDSWYLIKYCKHFSLAFSCTSRVALLELDSIDSTSTPRYLLQCDNMPLKAREAFERVRYFDSLK